MQALLATDFYPDFGGDPALAISALERAGIEVVSISDETLPQGFDTALPLLSYGFRASAEHFFAGLGAATLVLTPADVVLYNAEDLAGRAPYGQAFVAASAQDTLGDEAYERLAATAHNLAAGWIQRVLTQNRVDLLVTGMLYTSHAGAAGVPALTIPAGLDPTGAPQGIVLAGAPFCEPDLLAVGFALEQVLHGTRGT